MILTKESQKYLFKHRQLKDTGLSTTKTEAISLPSKMRVIDKRELSAI